MLSVHHLILDVRNFVLESVDVAMASSRQLEPPAHKGITNPLDPFSKMSSVLEDQDINRFFNVLPKEVLHTDAKLLKIRQDVPFKKW